MAVPDSVNIRNLSGRYTLNKTLSDNQEAFFVLQGLGWFTRKAVKMATIILELKQHELEGEVHIDIKTHAGSLSTQYENRVCNWEDRKHHDNVFGNVIGKSRFIMKKDYQSGFTKATDEDTQFLLAERLTDGSPSCFLHDEIIQSLATNQDAVGWIVDQNWGFEMVNGEKRYTRRLVCKNKTQDKTEVMRLVYDYNGPLE